jgi:hypothetical protein
MAVNNVLVEPVSQADTDIAESKILRSYIRPSAAFGGSWTAARELGACLRGAELQARFSRSGGSDWRAAEAAEGLLPGVMGAGEMSLAIEAAGAEVVGVAVWASLALDLKLECMSGSLCATV